MTDDSDLLRRYAWSQSDEAFGELVRRHLNLVYRAAMRQNGGDAHRAQDAAQAVFILLARRAAALVEHGSLAGWLHATTGHIVRNTLWDERRRQARELEATLMNSDKSATDAAPDAGLTGKLLEEALNGLGRRDREAILLRFFEERSFAEVGVALRMSEDAARMRVARSLEKMRIRLGRRGIVSTTVALGALLTGEGVVAAPAGLTATITTAAVAGGKTVSIVASFLAFMSTTKLVTTTAVLLVGLGVGVAVFEARREAFARTALAEAEHDNQRLLARVGAAEARARSARGGVIAAQDAAERMRAEAARSPAKTEAQTAGRAFLAAHPAVRETMRDQKRAVIRGQYFLLFRELRLDEARRAAFEEILLDGPEGTVKFLPGADRGGMETTMGEGISSAEKYRRLFRLLGKESYDKYMSGQFALPLDSASLVAGGALFSSVATTVAGAVYFGEEALSTEQVRQLNETVAEERRKPPLDRRNADPASYWDGISELARGFLSERQLEALQLLRLRDEFQRSQRVAAEAAAAAGGRRP